MNPGSETRVYHLFGRKDDDIPMAFVGRVTAPLGQLPPIPPSDEEWLELIAFAETAIIRVIPWEESEP
jgi:hypothetical protein